jgi:hypothetical protein
LYYTFENTFMYIKNKMLKFLQDFENGLIYFILNSKCIHSMISYCPKHTIYLVHIHFYYLSKGHSIGQHPQEDLANFLLYTSDIKIKKVLRILFICWLHLLEPVIEIFVILELLFPKYGELKPIFSPIYPLYVSKSYSSHYKKNCENSPKKKRRKKKTLPLTEL